jgi:hypothetical protein
LKNAQVRLNLYKLLREQSRGLKRWRQDKDNRPSSSLSSLATALSNELSTNDTDTAANEITPADNNTMSSDPDSDDGDGEGGKDKTSSEQANKSFAGMFSTHLKDKAKRSARVSKQTRLQRGHWQEKYAEMTCEERQDYFKVKHQKVDEKALMSTQPEHEPRWKQKERIENEARTRRLSRAFSEKLRNFCRRRRNRLLNFWMRSSPQLKPLEKRLISQYLKYRISSISLL